MSNKKTTKNHLIISIVLTVLVLSFNMLVDILYRDEVVFLQDDDKAGIFFIFTLVTLIALVVQIKNIFAEKEKRIIKSFLILITLYALYYQFFATVSVNFL